MPSDSSSAIVSKVWNYAHVLKAAGVGASDYVEQITYLLFLKLADEMTGLGFDNPIPPEFQWSELSGKSGDELEWSGATWTTRQGCPEGERGGAHQVHYRHTLEKLGKQPGLVGLIFRKAQNKIANPSDLARVIKMIADEDWSDHFRLVRPVCPSTNGAGGKSFHLFETAGPQLVNGNEAGRRDLHELKCSFHLLSLQAGLQELHLIDQRSLVGLSLNGIFQGLFKVQWEHRAKHSEMLLILPTHLVKTEQTVALALKEQDGIHDRNPIDSDRSRNNLINLALTNPVDAGHQIDLKSLGPLQSEDAKLPIRRRGPLDQRPLIGLTLDVAKNCQADPNVTIFGSEGLELCSASR